MTPIKFTRSNLMQDYEGSSPVYVYDSEGQFHHGYTKLRIVKNDRTNLWDLKAKKAGFRFDDYREGFNTKREAIEFATDRLLVSEVEGLCSFSEYLVSTLDPGPNV